MSLNEKMKKEFEDFESSNFSLEIWSREKLAFRSKKRGLEGLLNFIGKHGRRLKNLIIFDKVIGNAVALLCVYLRAREVYGIIGSKSAEKTFRKFKIKYYFKKTRPNILNKMETDLCPFEKLSFKKAAKEFYSLLKNR